MNKKSTLLAAALMAVSSLTVSAAESTETSPYKAGNYHYLKATIAQQEMYLSVCDSRADSIVAKTLSSDASVVSRDLALWEIIEKEEANATYYQIRNKKTKAILSFDPNGTTILGEGANKWTISDNAFFATYGDGEKLSLKKEQAEDNTGNAVRLVFSADNSGKHFKVETRKDEIVTLEAKDITSFDSFKLSFGEDIEDNIFEGKEFVAIDVKDGNSAEDAKYVKLQVKGKDQFLGIGKESWDLTNAEGAYGAKFKLYSEEELKDNSSFAEFAFTRYLINDSLTIKVRQAPNLKEDGKIDDVSVVYTSFNGKKYLTVGSHGVDQQQGEILYSTVKKASPVTNLKKGVYFLKSASKKEGGNGGQYIENMTEGKLEYMATNEKPSKYLVDGQWYLKPETGLYSGLYSLVDRKDDSNILMKGEVFKVEGMENTYTFGSSADSITLELQNDVDLNNRHIGSAYYSKETLVEDGFVLNNVPTGMTESDLYVVASEAMLKIESGDQSDALTFKLDSADVDKEFAGALSIGDTVDVVSYKLKSRFGEEYIVKNEAEQLELGEAEEALEFQFISDFTGSKYEMKIVGEDNEYVSIDPRASVLKVSTEIAYFKLLGEEAPIYGTFETGYKRFTSDAKSLTMNPLNSFAEVKQEGQDILKSTYEKDNFSLWMIKSKVSTAEKPLYFITTTQPSDAEEIRYYMASSRTNELATENVRVKFIADDTVEDIKESANNPALWALKVTENGDYLLENQSENKTPYVAIINGVVVMAKSGAEFSLENAPAPVANESIEAPTTIKVIGGNGEFQIRNAGGKKVTLSNILGQTIGSRFISSDNESVQTARGVVIVSVEGDKAYKVIVK